MLLKRPYKIGGESQISGVAVTNVNSQSENKYKRLTGSVINEPESMLYLEKRPILLDSDSEQL